MAVLDNLRMLEAAPGVAMSELPPESMLPEVEEEEEPDERYGARLARGGDALRDDEYYEEDERGGR